MGMKQLKLKGKLLGLFLTILLIYSVVSIGVVRYYVSELAVTSLKEKLNANIELGYSLLDAKYPGSWTVKGDQLYKGDTLINNNFELVDEVKDKTDSIATIFLGDTRVSTNVLKGDGSRAVGTQVSEKVKEVVLKQGKDYIGQADVVGTSYITQYTPIKDASG